MKAARFVWFFIMIAAGVAIGLYYAWIVNPVQYVNATFYDLRQDFKADYVLMAAEIYNKTPNLFQTMMRIDRLLENSPEEAVENAIINAGNLGYSEADVDMLYQLNDAVGGKVIENPAPDNVFIEFNAQTPAQDMTPTIGPSPTAEEENPFLAEPDTTIVPVISPTPAGGAHG